MGHLKAAIHILTLSISPGARFVNIFDITSRASCLRVFPCISDWILTWWKYLTEKSLSASIVKFFNALNRSKVVQKFSCTTFNRKSLLKKKNTSKLTILREYGFNQLPAQLASFYDFVVICLGQLLFDDIEYICIYVFVKISHSSCYFIDDYWQFLIVAIDLQCDNFELVQNHNYML